MKSILLMGIAIVLAACSPVTLRFNAQTPQPASITLSSSKIVIPAGMAIEVLARPFQYGDQMDSDITTFDITVDDGSILGVEVARFTQNSYVFYGIKPGNTVINYDVDGMYFGRIDAVVTAPSD